MKKAEKIMNDPLWTSVEAAAITGGRNSAPWQAKGVSINTDSIRPGDVFIASPHDDIHDVFARGASAAVVPGFQNRTSDHPLLTVSDTYQALQSLAGAARFQTHAHVIAVQGMQPRRAVYAGLNRVSDTHWGGHHVSLGLANLPEEADYGIFGLSPMVRPDIAVITNPARAHEDTLFSTMPASGIVILNADDPESLSLLPRIRASGIQTVLTYGCETQADIMLHEIIPAANGTALSLNILGMDTHLMMAADFNFEPAFLAALLILKLTGRPIFSMSDVYNSMTVKGTGEPSLSIASRTQRNLHMLHTKPQASEAVFRVANLVDYGAGRQTAVLETMGGLVKKLVSSYGLSLPKRMGKLNFMMTGKQMSAVQDATACLESFYRKDVIETIVPEVLAPGDFIVFKDIWNKSRARFSKALRVMPSR